MVRERPIPYTGSMVRSLLTKRKQMTRRIVKGNFDALLGSGNGIWRFGRKTEPDTMAVVDVRCPYGVPGDRLWVRERIDLHGSHVIGGEEVVRSVYAADRTFTVADAWPWQRNFIPPMFCPRGLSRITLEITEIGVERLNDISEEDADAEGCERLDTERYEPDWKLCPCCGGTRLYTAFSHGGGALPDTDCMKCDTYVKRYRHLWNSINGSDAWDRNPWVWAVSFKDVTA